MTPQELVQKDREIGLRITAMEHARLFWSVGGSGTTEELIAAAEKIFQYLKNGATK